MGDQEFSRVIKKYLPKRLWSDISDKWLSNLPHFQDPVSRPDPSLKEFYSLSAFLISLGDNVPVQHEIGGLREVIFTEGIYLLHKAINVLCAAELHAKEGILTWSLSSAYHSSFFCAKAIIRILGVATVEAALRSCWIIDVFPELPKLTSKERKSGMTPEPMTDFLAAQVFRIEHRHIWKIFQRLMRISKFEEDILERLRGAFSKYFDDKIFPKQRNYIHYNNDRWLFDDLYRFSPDPEFGIRKISAIEKLILDNIESDFSMLIAISMIYFAINLLTSLSLKTHKIDAELKTIMDSLTSARHPLYVKSI